MANPISSPIANAAAKAFGDVVEGLTMKNLLKGVNLGALSAVSHSADNRQVAALNNDDMSRGTSGPGVGV